nr:uncharacterized protein LOC117274948 [Nicotiana tomentosiformis]
MVVSKTPTRSHGAGGSGKPPSKKSPTDKNVAKKGNTEARTKARHDKVKTGTSEVDPEATYLSTERPAQIQQRACQARPSRPREVLVQIREGASKPPPAKKRKVAEVKEKGKATSVVESESEDDSADEEEAAIQLTEGDGEPSVPSATNMWETKFVIESAWNKWKNIQTKQINPILFERPLNFKDSRAEGRRNFYSCA